MNDIKKERLMMAIISISAMACFAESYIAGWEFWVPPLITFGLIVIWWIHISQKLETRYRPPVYFMYTALVVFYFGIHKDMEFDLSVVIMLFMSTFAMLDSVRILNYILIEYVALLAIQFYIGAQAVEKEVDALIAMKGFLHIASVITLYLFTRITIHGRLRDLERLAKWKTNVNENNSDMEDFLSNISHELRTPVNVINGMTTLMQNDRTEEGLSAVKEAGIRLSHHIEDIQDYTEIKRGELMLEEEKYMCISLINDVVSYFRMIDNRNRLEFIVDLDPGVPAVLKGDIKKLHKLFRHLVGNAIKFSKRGGVYIRVSSVEREYGVNLLIDVTDTGVGMSRAEISMVSRGMYQANKKRNRSTGGIGIGLPIVYGFVHKMGGFVKITSRKGQGTTVHLSIPQQIVDNTPCLALREGFAGDILFYIKPEKYKVPELREFNRNMAVNLATGLRVPLYSVSDQRDLNRLIDELHVTHIFLGQEEYEAEGRSFDELARQGYTVVVSADPGFSVAPGSKVLVMAKPLYGFPVVRIINGEQDDSVYGFDDTDQVSYDGVRALVVDDEPMNLVVATGLLKKYNMITDTAERGKEAIEKYRNGDYDVIFMDHMMPEMDGVEAMKGIRELAQESGRNPVIIALTANALSGAREMFIREGFDGFIAKPIDIGEFERVMKRVLPDGSTLRSDGRTEA